jgi:hypothetical protein
MQNLRGKEMRDGVGSSNRSSFIRCDDGGGRLHLQIQEAPTIKRGKDG